MGTGRGARAFSTQPRQNVCWHGSSTTGLSKSCRQCMHTCGRGHKFVLSAGWAERSVATEPSFISGGGGGGTSDDSSEVSATRILLRPCRRSSRMASCSFSLLALLKGGSENSKDQGLQKLGR